MIYDFMVEEFKNNFHPTFKEQGLDTLILLGGEAIVRKNEAEQSYTFLKEYPPEIKDFIIAELTKVLKPKYFLATYYPETGKIVTQKGIEVKAALVKNNHLLNILNFLEVKEMSGLLVRKIDEQYEFRPVIEEIDNGYNLALKKAEVLALMQVTHPHLLPESLRLKATDDASPVKSSKDS